MESIYLIFFFFVCLTHNDSISNSSDYRFLNKWKLYFLKIIDRVWGGGGVTHRQEKKLFRKYKWFCRMSRETIINPGRFQNPSSTPTPTPPTTSSLPHPPPKKNRWIQMEKTKLSDIAFGIFVSNANSMHLRGVQKGRRSDIDFA